MSDHEQTPLTNPDENPTGSEPSESANGEDADVPEDVEQMPFEEAIEELETIVEQLEDGDIALEEAMERFEQGLGLVEACRSKLDQAELKVEELLDDGETAELNEG
jgi:exodeoxyribonuclease VII small subunit